MKLTKYEHACFVLEDQGRKLVVDPGMFSNLQQDLSNTDCIVITHMHADHFALENIEKILEQSPDAKIFAAEEVAAQVEYSICPEAGKAYQAGPFSLKFYGDTHEEVRPDFPRPKNLGVNINGLVAYPGDSFSQDPNESKVLMAPAAGPWLRMKEACEHIAKSNSLIIVPTHDAVLSEAGMKTHDSHLSTVAENSGKQYRRLQTGNSIEV